MPALPQVPATFNFGAVKTSTSSRYLQQGEVTLLRNYTRDVDGTLIKRKGHDRTDVSAFNGGTYQGPATEMIASDSVIWRDSDDQLWARDGSTGFYRGQDLRATPTWYQTQNIATSSATQHRAVLANGDLWSFYIEEDGSGYVVTVLDPVSGVVKAEPKKVTMGGSICAIAVAADANGVVYLLAVTGYIDILCDVYTAPGVTPSSRAFYTHSDQAFIDIDARLLTATGEIAVVALSNPGSSTDISTLHAYMNTTTSPGNAKTSPAPVFTTQAGLGVGAPVCAGGVSVLNESGSAGYVRYSFWRAKNMTDGQLVRVKADASTLAIIDTVEMYAETFGDTNVASMSGGILDGANEVYLSTGVPSSGGGSTQSDTMRGTGGTVTSSKVRRHIYNGTSVTTDVAAPSAYLVGRPFELGGRIYFVSGFDDGPTTRAQRGYFLRTDDGALVTSIMSGEGAAVGVTGVITPVVLDSSKVLLPLAQEGFTSVTPAPSLATIDFNADYYSNASGVLPGGIPKTVSRQDVLTELAPIHFPYEAPTVLAGDGVTNLFTSRFTWQYAVINSKNEFVPSAQYPTQEQVFHDLVSYSQYKLTIPTLRHTIGPTWIILYGTAPSGVDLFIQQLIPNDPTVDSVTITIDPTTWDDKGELIAGGLPNTKANPARIVIEHQNRLFFAGTPDDTIQYTREFTTGHGPGELNGVFSAGWRAGTGPITAMCSAGFDTLVVFRENAIGVLTGPGPDGNGSGNYVVQTLPTKKGVKNPNAVCLGPLGVYFQNAADGRWNLVSNGAVTEINTGTEAYRTEVPVAAVHVEGERAVKFLCESGKQIVFGYTPAPIDQPAGQIYEHASDGLPAAVGCQVISGSPVMLAAGGAITASFYEPGDGYQDDLASVLIKLRTGKMGFAGFLNEFDVQNGTISSTGSGSSYVYRLIADRGATEIQTDPASAVADVWFDSAVFRTRDVTLEIEETTSDGAGRSFDGISFTFRPYGKVQNPYRRI